MSVLPPDLPSNTTALISIPDRNVIITNLGIESQLKYKKSRTISSYGGKKIFSESCLLEKSTKHSSTERKKEKKNLDQQAHKSKNNSSSSYVPYNRVSESLYQASRQDAAITYREENIIQLELPEHFGFHSSITHLNIFTYLSSNLQNIQQPLSKHSTYQKKGLQNPIHSYTPRSRKKGEKAYIARSANE